jgi:hypothetical protein
MLHHHLCLDFWLDSQKTMVPARPNFALRALGFLQLLVVHGLTFRASPAACALERECTQGRFPVCCKPKAMPEGIQAVVNLHDLQSRSLFQHARLSTIFTLCANV